MGREALSNPGEGRGLSKHAKCLLDDYADGGAPSRHRKRRMLDELERAVEQDAAPLFPLAEIDPNPPNSARPRTRTGTRAGFVLGFMAVAAAVAALTWTRIDARVVLGSDGGPHAAQDLVDHAPTVEDAAFRAAESARSAQRTARRTAPSPLPSPRLIVAPEFDAAEPAKPTPSVAQSKPKPKPTPSLDDEAASLSSVRRALKGGDATLALRLLSEHGDQFRGGLLEQERKVLHVRALCAAGRVVQAERRRIQFVTRFPDSPHIKTMEKPCTHESAP